MRKAVTTDKAPRPIGPYSQAIIDNDLVYVAGQGPANPATGQLELGDVASQTRRTFQNLRAIVEAAGSSMDRVIRCNVYLKDIADFAAMNEVYKEQFQAPYPARTTIQAGALPGGIAVEIDCIARLTYPGGVA
jgi:reactive intermediate/imine deaminase